VARVDVERCTGSGQCVEVCHYEGAISLQTVMLAGQEVQRAVVAPANCVGCGMCVSACPKRAIDVQGWTLNQYEVMVDAIADDRLLAEVLA
jgi:heterodisulfide reductase subunit A